MFIFAAPNWQRCTPVTIAGERPVDVVIEPIAIATILNRFGIPIGLLIFAQQRIFNRGGSDVPGWLCVINQSSVAAPAMRIRVLVWQMLKENAASFQLFHQSLVSILKEEPAH